MSLATELLGQLSSKLVFSNLVNPRTRELVVRVPSGEFVCEKSGQPIFSTHGVPDFLESRITETGGVEQVEEKSDDFEVDFDYSPKAKLGHASAVSVDLTFQFRDSAIDKLSESMGRKLDILDIGSGAMLTGTGGVGGRHFKILKEHSRSYASIDPSPIMVQKVMIEDGNLFHLPNPCLVRGVGEMLPFADESYDVILMISVIDHFADPVQAMTEAKRVLRPGGIVVIDVQNFGSWPKRLAKLVFPQKMKRREELDHHATKFDLKKLRALIESSGLSLLKLKGCSYFRISSLIGSKLENAVWFLPRMVLGKRFPQLLDNIDGVCQSVLPSMPLNFELVLMKESGKSVAG